MSFWFVKGPKRANRRLLWQRKSRKISRFCDLFICKLKSAVAAVKSQINFQVELLSMIDRKDIEIASIFHLVESMLANALFITVV